MRNHPSRVNTVILKSIPLNRKVKRYWISKYERIAENCGTEEACKKFKQLRNALLAYKSDPNRKSNLDRYLSSTGFRINGMLRSLFEACDCQPQFVLNFLKLYSAPTQDRKDLQLVAKETQARLDTVKANPSVPKYLYMWLQCVFGDYEYSYDEARDSEKHPFHRTASIHTFEEWKEYWKKWRKILTQGWKSGKHLDSKAVYPEVYKDYRKADKQSDSYEKDFARLAAMHLPEVRLSGIPGILSDKDLSFVDEFLDEDVSRRLSEITLSADDGVIRRWLGDDPYEGIFVGEVQHLPKKGGGTDYRDIAVPNRFIQAALEPISDRLYHLLQGLPKDATFNQSKFDRTLVNRVTNGNLYQGSVDLSKATDNLPRSWGFAIVDRIRAECNLSPEERFLEQAIFGSSSVRSDLERRADASWTLFKHVSAANWVDGGTRVDHWKVGQPLGSLPSFALLGLTHNLWVEAMSCTLGLLHSPYVILGDDIVIFNRKLRKKYIQECISRSIPLSLNKSYEGELSEFAGTTFIKGLIPFHTSDHGPVTFQSLFDYQRATGVQIPWDNLPQAIKKRYRKAVASWCKQNGLPSKSVMHMVDASYKLLLALHVQYAGSSSYQAVPDNWLKSGVIERFYEIRYSQEIDSKRRKTRLSPGYPSSGITFLKGAPVKLLSEEYACKDGWYLRFRPVELPQWYVDKFRPCSTDSAILASLEALRTTV